MIPKGFTTPTGPTSYSQTQYVLSHELCEIS